MRFLSSWIVFGVLMQAAEVLVGPEWLEKHWKDPNLVILHSGSDKDFGEGHIAGARLVRLPDLSVSGENNLRLQLPTTEALRAALLKLGVGNGSRVVIYTGNESVQSATRVWFTFDYLSLEASMLDGGLAGWKAKGLPVTQAAPEFAAATELTVRARPELVVDADWLKNHLKDPKVSLIDARLDEFYTGKNAGNMPRAGHIPGAVSVPFPTLLGAAKEFLPKAEIEAKLGPAKPIVAYCHIGMQATVVYFSARLAGRDVKLYDGSYEDWSRRMELPVDGPVQGEVK